MRSPEEFYNFCDQCFAELGVSKYFVTKKLEIPSTTFQVYRKRQLYLNFETMCKLADFLNMSIDGLVGRDCDVKKADSISTKIVHEMKCMEEQFPDIIEMGDKLKTIDKKDRVHIKALIDSY